MAREFIVPGQIINGAGALNMAESSLAQLGKKAMIVTDKVMIELGNCEKLENALKNQGIEYIIYSEITGEPTDKMVEEGLALYKAQNCDFLIALGGGSPIDAMKAIASLTLNGGSIASYMGKEIAVEMPPIVAIPTTAGTGSEATQFTIITDTRNNVKMLLKGKVLMPRLAVIDPQFTMTAPPKITAATGLDALCHAIEAYTSRKSQEMSDTFALSAVKRIFRYLPKAFHNGQDEEARVQMSVAALEAGIALNNASVTLIHGMSRPIGA
ncbi:MAG: iron-containing alcohol dehydrogenase, partial [Kineothrix sp.]|nr:iron-containing alcohol dehydrogenase [Kineothrix sp.]